jgi:predicted transcriptional regulator of viral defense system
LTEIILQILKADRDTDLQEIYAEIRETMPFTREQRETTYRVPNFQHSVRSILSALVKKGKAIRVRRGVYRKARNATSKT